MNRLLVRTLSSIGIVAAVALAMFTNHLVFGALMIIVLYFALVEFFHMSIGPIFIVQKYLGLISAFIFFIIEYISAFYGLEHRYFALNLIPLLLLCISCLFIPTRLRGMLIRLPHIFFGLLYIGLPVGLSPILMVKDGRFDGMLMFSLLILIWASDVGAYLVGSGLGQRPGSHKLAPNISPRKSWWGVIGGVLCCIICGNVLNMTGWLPIGSIHSTVVSFIIASTGICGDLFESLWKRHFGFKDSGNIIPGHGGMLDRIDSALFAIPSAAVYLMIFNLI